MRVHDEGSVPGHLFADGPAAENKHVLLISIDGMHQSDLAWYVAKHPSSPLAEMTHHGALADEQGWTVFQLATLGTSYVDFERALLRAAEPPTPF